MTGNRLATLTTALMLAGIAAAIYFREPAEQVATDPAQGSAMGLAGLFGIAVAIVIVRITVRSR